MSNLISIPYSPQNGILAANIALVNKKITQITQQGRIIQGEGANQPGVNKPRGEWAGGESSTVRG